MARTVNIRELAKVIRSKNAGPFLTTIDLFFDSDEKYRLVRDSGLLTRERVAQLYRIPVEDVVGVFHYDAARGIKVTTVKPGRVASGDPESADVFGAQQYTPLLALEVPLPE